MNGKIPFEYNHTSKNESEKEMERNVLMVQYEHEYRNRAQNRHLEEAIKQEFIFVDRYGKMEEFNGDEYDADQYHYFSDESDDDLDNPAKFVQRQEALELDFNHDLDSSDDNDDEDEDEDF